MAYGEPEWEQFATAKLNYWETGNPQRAQSNNTLLFYEKPTRQALRDVFALMEKAGGSEPGFANAAEALRRAPWFRGFNPCAEILLGDKSFCNLVELLNGQSDLHIIDLFKMALQLGKFTIYEVTQRVGDFNMMT